MLFNCLEVIKTISPATAGIALLAIVIVLLYHYLKNKDLPPGPIGLPLVGILPFLKLESFHLQLQDMAKKYGDVFSFYFTGHLYIHLGSIKALREALVTKHECFSEKDSNFNMISYIFDEGLLAANGEQWRVLRKFCVQYFKEYGMISLKGNMAGPIYDIVSSTVDDLKAKNGDPVSITDLLGEKCSSIVRKMLFADDGITEEEHHELNMEYAAVVDNSASYNLLLAGEFARRVIFPLSSRCRKVTEHLERMNNLLYKVIARHEANYDENHIRDIIDSFFKERDDREKKGDPTAKYFTVKALASSISQFIGDGGFGAGFFVGTVIQALAEHPEEQDKIYKELIDIVGVDREATMDDKSKLTYTNAFINEVMRTSEIFPLFPTVKCTKDTTLDGYRIPKGTMTIMNLWAAQHDPKEFEEPYRFNPSRYMPEPGKKRPELPVLFGIGKRSCAGEAYTMMQVFLFTTHIVKNFRLSFPDPTASKCSMFFGTGKMVISAIPRESPLS